MDLRLLSTDVVPMGSISGLACSTSAALNGPVLCASANAVSMNLQGDAIGTDPSHLYCVPLGANPNGGDGTAFVGDGEDAPAAGPTRWGASSIGVGAPISAIASVGDGTKAAFLVGYHPNSRNGPEVQLVAETDAIGEEFMPPFEVREDISGVPLITTTSSTQSEAAGPSAQTANVTCIAGTNHTAGVAQEAVIGNSNGTVWAMRVDPSAPSLTPTHAARIPGFAGLPVKHVQLTDNSNVALAACGHGIAVMDTRVGGTLSVVGMFKATQGDRINCFDDSGYGIVAGTEAGAVLVFDIRNNNERYHLLEHAAWAEVNRQLGPVEASAIVNQTSAGLQFAHRNRKSVTSVCCLNQQQFITGNAAGEVHQWRPNPQGVRAGALFPFAPTAVNKAAQLGGQMVKGGLKNGGANVSAIAGELNNSYTNASSTSMFGVGNTSMSARAEGHHIPGVAQHLHHGRAPVVSVVPLPGGQGCAYVDGTGVLETYRCV